MSGGEQQMVALGRALMSAPNYQAPDVAGRRAASASAGWGRSP
jgi:predicted ABC-type transport system involved in lysophospholipase L1 biosynthesis ATPase subunit